MAGSPTSTARLRRRADDADRSGGRRGRQRQTGVPPAVQCDIRRAHADRRLRLKQRAAARLQEGREPLSPPARRDRQTDRQTDRQHLSTAFGHNRLPIPMPQIEGRPRCASRRFRLFMPLFMRAQRCFHSSRVNVELCQIYKLASRYLRMLFRRRVCQLV